MSRVASVKPLDDYRLSLTFLDGTQGVVSIRDRLFGPVFEPLRELGIFRQVRVDEFGVAWPNVPTLPPMRCTNELRDRLRRFYRRILEEREEVRKSTM